eukprot:m.40140 g.40140  ORF g.40140 m.40140 type:complete len:276 (-) comp8044_c0_seq2:2652-3479(-)
MVAVVVMAVVGLAVMVPLLLQVLAALTASWRSLTGTRGAVATAIRGWARRLEPERAVVSFTVAMISCAIWMHWSRMMMRQSVIGFIFLDLVPSIWINLGMYFNLYYAATIPGGAVSDGMTPDEERSSHLCRRCKRACYQQDHHCIFTANCVGRDNYGYFFGFVLWGWIATVYAVWLTAQPYLLCDTDDYRGAPTCSSQYRTLFLVSSLSLVALTLLSSLVVSLAASGQTIRGFLSDRPPLLAVKPGRHLENIEVRLGPAAQWWRLLVPGLGVDTS